MLNPSLPVVLLRAQGPDRSAVRSLALLPTVPFQASQLSHLFCLILRRHDPSLLWPRPLCSLTVSSLNH